MKGDFIDKEMEQVHADGVDFVPITFFLFDTTGYPTVYESYTREEWENQRMYPKSGRMYWKFDSNKQKQYIKD